MNIELLSPAGSVDVMYAAYAAGADAVYIGGALFGARAFASNADQEDLLKAIDYAHLHDKKLYLTVNTLIKEKEMEEKLYEYLLPYYNNGLDAVIVQDMGTVKFIHEHFPEIHIHASTQMTITGELAASRLKSLGVNRVVLPREMSLKEISKISTGSGLEIEGFVHGALCYCYSGQCLFSSIAGGRSGNRGRCAQPCRMSYTVTKDGKKLADERRGFVLSPKDLCTIDILPEIIQSGVTSLKIEGRMKKAEYTAGVVSIYRKYLDRYLENPNSRYAVDDGDKKLLADLFNRNGFTQGYYKQHNGKSMITFTKPEFRIENKEFNEFINSEYIGRKLKENIKGNVKIFSGEPVILDAEYEKAGVSVQVTGDNALKAVNRPLDEAGIAQKLRKINDTDFIWEELKINTDNNSFFQIGSLNELKRSLLKKLEEKILEPFHRKDALEYTAPEESHDAECKKSLEHTVSVENMEQLQAVAEDGFADSIYIDSHICDFEKFGDIVKKIHEKNKKCLLLLPKLFRQENEELYIKNADTIKAAGFDGIIACTAEALIFAQRYLEPERLVADHSLYIWNNEAKKLWKSWGADVLTLPFELNSRELSEIADESCELIVYGRIPMMVSAQCIKCNTSGCNRKNEQIELTDRLGNVFPVKNYCRECMNIIYNNRPLMLADQWNTIRKMQLGGVRLMFTTESASEVRRVLKVFGQKQGKNNVQEALEITRGHFKRGVD